MLKMNEIKERFQAATDSMLPEFIVEFQSDERQGVQKLVESAKKKLRQLEEEKIRTEKLKEYEYKYGEYQQ